MRPARARTWGQRLTLPSEAMRVDKWLWAARFFKTRQLAVDAIENHRVEVNGQACKPGRAVKPGDCLALRQPDGRREFVLVALASHRGPASAARLLYQETQASAQAAAQAAERRRLSPEPAASIEHGRPTKRDRRDLVRWDRWSATWPSEPGP